MRSFIKRLVGERFVSFYRGYSVIPGVLVQELHRMLGMVRSRRRYANDLEVLLCQLRTSAHIVDKGLQADDWTRDRGRAPYETLCKCVDLLKDSALSTDPSYLWAVAKKGEYEGMQRCGRVTRHSVQCTDTRVDKNDLLHLIQSRRSSRSFHDRPIPPGVLRELTSAVHWAPTSCNRQSAKLFVTCNPATVALCLEQCAGATCLGNAAPCFIAACADSRFYMAQDYLLPYIDVALGIENMLLLAHSHGIGGTVLNWMHHTSREEALLRTALKIPEYYTIVLNLVIGYAAKSVSAPARKSSDLGYTVIE